MEWQVGVGEGREKEQKWDHEYAGCRVHFSVYQVISGLFLFCQLFCASFNVEKGRYEADSCRKLQSDWIARSLGGFNQ